MKKLFTTFVMLGCMIFYTTAQIIDVPVDQPTIQAGIDSASSGDTVLVAEGTYFENINFKGKAITLASLFIMDGDTAHISRTIIDGSQASNPDSASVVYMCSGEDTTSVLMGFTITGGKGTDFIRNVINRKERAGGGVFINASGGKITHNIIEENHVKRDGGPDFQFGGGVFACVFNNHSVLIRKNIIRNNAVTAKNAFGAGIDALRGRIIIEDNEITNNSSNAELAYGGGLATSFGDVEGVIKEAIIRNNLISSNSANSSKSGGGGGGYYQGNGYGEENIRVYNNLICNNHSAYAGGGVLFWDDTQGRVFNNTIIDNTANSGKNVGLWGGVEIALFNNIIWSYVNSTIPEFNLWLTDAAKLRIFNNIIMSPFQPGDGVTAFDNRYDEPIFQSGSYALAENSPGIGWGIDSVQINDTKYYAPVSDFYGNKRPDPVDPYVDAGAVESEFPRPVYHDANLTHIGLWDRKLLPDFHKDSLHYVLPVPDTTVMTPQLDVVAEDWLAEIDINNAYDIGSADPADRTTNITVTADDGYTQKTYAVLFRYASADATLSKLYISKGALVPEFQTDSLIYTVCLPKDQTLPPEITCESTDTNATISVVYAPRILLQNPWPEYRHYRTTVINIIAEDGIHKAKYEIEHLIDKTVPFITLADDTVLLNNDIKVTSTEDGYIYLVPVNTSKNTDSVMVHMIDSAIVRSHVAAYLPASDTGTYWLYAIDSCLNISSKVAVTIIDTSKTGISENMIGTVQLYPNPVDQMLYIETDQTISSVELFNLIGVKIMDESKPEGRIDMGHLEQGIYFIRIRTDKGEVYTGKVMKR